MTLLAMDGLAYYGNNTQTQRNAHTVSNPPVDPDGGPFNSVHRNGRWGMGNQADEAGLLTTNTDPTFIWQGYLRKNASADLTPGRLLRFHNFGEGVDHVAIIFNGDGSVEAQNGDATTLGTVSEPGIWHQGMWNFIECKVLISDTVGTVDLNINGRVIFTITSADTRNGGTNSWCDMLIYDTSNASAYSISNTVMMNSSGSAFNGFLGPRRIYTMFPTANSSVTWTRSSTTSSSWDLIDELDNDGDTTFVESLSTGDIDMYVFQNLSTTATSIDAIGVNIAARESTATAARNMRLRIDSTGNIATGATIALSTSYLIYQSVFEVDPNGGGAWSVSAVDALLAGIEVIA